MISSKKRVSHPTTKLANGDFAFRARKVRKIQTSIVTWPDKHYLHFPQARFWIHPPPPQNNIFNILCQFFENQKFFPAAARRWAAAAGHFFVLKIELFYFFFKKIAVFCLKLVERPLGDLPLPGFVKKKIMFCHLCSSKRKSVPQNGKWL